MLILFKKRERNKIAKLGDIVFRVDKFFKDTRIIRCINMDCRFLMKNEIQCNFKEISLDGQGCCCEFELLENKENTTKGE